MWNEYNCAVVWAFSGIAFLGIEMKTDLFQSCGHCWVFPICWHIECSTFTASSFRIWRHGNPPHYSCLKNPMDRGAFVVHRIAKSQTRLKQGEFSSFFFFICSSVFEVWYSSVIFWNFTVNCNIWKSMTSLLSLLLKNFLCLSFYLILPMKYRIFLSVPLSETM